MKGRKKAGRRSQGSQGIGKSPGCGVRLGRDLPRPLLYPKRLEHAQQTLETELFLLSYPSQRKELLKATRHRKDRTQFWWILPSLGHYWLVFN